MTTQERFATDWDMPLHTVAAVVAHAKRAGFCNERHCNGDPHPKATHRGDKNECAELWDAAVADEAVKIMDLVRPFGFTEVAFTGLYPCLKRGTRFVDLPLD